MAKSGLLTGTRTIYDKDSGSSKGSYSVQYYDLCDDLSIGLVWDAHETNTSVYMSPAVIRWDSQSTDNYGGTFDETLNPDANNNMSSASWSDISWSSNNASGWSGWYDTFATRTYAKKTTAQTIKLTIKSYELYSYGYGTYGSDTSTFSYTVPALASYSVIYNANGGTTSTTPAKQTKWYGTNLTLTTATPSKASTTTTYTVTFNYNGNGTSNTTAKATKTTPCAFSKWNTKADGTGTAYNKGGTFGLNATTTLYAQWTAGTATTSAVSLPAATYTGYILNGWYTATSGGTKRGAGGGTYTPTQSETLYAQWTAATMTVQYHVNGGTIVTNTANATRYRASSSIVQQSTDSGSTWKNWTSSLSTTVTYKDLGNVGTPPITRTGYHVNSGAEWNTKADGTGNSLNQADSASNTTNKVTTQRINNGTQISSNVTRTIYVNWKPDTYTITYSANNGTGAPASQTKTYGVALTLTSATPTRTGYKFNKWNTASDGTGTAYSSGGSYTANAGATLYAQWTPCTVTVYFHANGGTITDSGGIHRYTSASDANSIYDFTISSNYVWSRHSTNGGTSWNSWDWRKHYTTVQSTATHADFYNIATYGITKTGYSTVVSYAYATTSAFTTAAANIFTQDDSTSNTYNVVTTTRLNGGTQITSDIEKTLYINWKPNEYTITYNANGGTGAPASQTKTHAVALTLTSATPTRTNYAFSKWNTAANGTGTAYNSGASYTANAGTTLYAQWTPYKVTVKYHVNGGTVVTNTASTTYQYRVNNNLAQYRRSTDDGATWSDWTDGSTNVTVEDTYKDLWNVTGVPITKTGYHTVASMAWNTNTSGTGNSFHQADTADNTINKVTTARLKGATLTADATVTLYVNWKPDEYTVSYAANGGTSTPADQTKYYGTALTLASAISKNSDTTTYTVTFNYNGNGTANTTSSAVKTTPYTFASWKATNGTTYAAGGSYTANDATQMTAQWTTGTSSTTTVALPSPVWSGHALDGWYTTSAATGGTKRGNGGASYTPTQSETLYARWVITIYTITYNANNGTDAPAVHTQNIGQNIKIAEPPIREGYKFNNWNTNSSGTGTSYNPGQIYTEQSNLTLYATWTAIKTISDIENVAIIDNYKHIPKSLIPNIWNKISSRFYGDILYDAGTVNWETIWDTIRNNPTTAEINISLSNSCYNYNKILIMGRTYNDIDVNIAIIPQRNKQFILKDSYYLSVTGETNDLYISSVPWSFSADGTKIEQNGVYKQQCIQNDGTSVFTNTFDIKITKVIGFKY